MYSPFNSQPSQVMRIEKYKQQLTTSEYKFTEQVAKFADIATTDFNKAWANIARPFRVEIFSQQANEYTLQNKIENIKKTVKGYELFIAVLVAKKFRRTQFLEDICSECEYQW